MRDKRLDILRFVAVALVLSWHTQFPSLIWSRGWTGVDLFFVLSGFLISGLLYTEYKSTSSINFKRFFVRRGLKIYPAFYVLIAVTGIACAIGWTGIPSGARNYLREVVFLQNYGPGLWDHTWSLAVEEHFYIGLALLLMLMVKLSPRVANPFRKIPVICASLGVGCLVLRGVTLWLYPNAHWRIPHPVYSMTHTRMDSLFFGVFIGYLYHFEPEVIRELFRSRGARVAIGVLSISLVLIGSTLTSRFYELTFGFTGLYLGFGGLLVLSLELHDVLKGRVARCVEWLGSGCAYVGGHSYSIYLWHLPFLTFVPYILMRFHVKLPEFVRGPFYFVGCCVLGMVLARLIEFPVLEFRDRFFPGLKAALKPVFAPAQGSRLVPEPAGLVSQSESTD
jgi:peptidoglycan/LPS O-acetylase OafA/YrhL